MINRINLKFLTQFNNFVWYRTKPFSELIQVFELHVATKTLQSKKLANKRIQS